MTTADKEQILVASLLDAWSDPLLPSKPGPAVCTALAYAPDYWESVEAARLAVAVVECSRRNWRTTPKNVERLLADEWKPWLKHPMFSAQCALPLSVAEIEALSLLPVYRDKRIIRTVADHYEKMLANPQSAREFALSLKLQLGDWL